MVEEKNSSRLRKSLGILFSVNWKMDILKEKVGKLKQFNTADLIPLKTGENIWNPCDFNDVSP